MVGSAGPVRQVTRARPAPRARATATPLSRPTVLPFTDPQPDSVAEGPGTGGLEEGGIEKGVAAFIKPPPMEVDHWYEVQFVAGPKEQNLRQETDGELDETSNIYVARKMRVTLLDNPTFEIKAKTEAEQMTGLDKTATWLWDVRPKSSDAQALRALVTVFKQEPDGSFSEIDSYRRSVRVTVHVGGMKRAIGAIDDASTLGEKLTKLFGTWQKTLAALVALLGAGGLLLWKLGLRKTKPE